MTTKEMEPLRDKLARVMVGRYGNDPLNKFLTIAALVLIFASMRWQSLYTFALLLMVLSLFRMFSRNIEKRQAEGQSFENIKRKIVHFFRSQKNTLFGTKTHRYFKCPGCKQQVRVPRGKGKISIHCPKCQADFQRKT